MTRRRIFFIPLFAVVLLFTLLFIRPPENVSAASAVTAKIDEKTGDLSFTLTAKKASSSSTPHWKTVGFYVTKKATEHNGSASAKASDCIFFDMMPKGCKTDTVYRDSLVYTKFTIPKKYVLEMCEKAKVDHKSLEESGGKIFLQGVLQGYKPSTGKALTERCYTLSQMQRTRYGHTVNGHYWSGIAWSGSCDEGWKQRFDIWATYVADESPVTINYYQWYNKRWNLVASVTNCKEGQIEKTSSGKNFTRNINSGDDPQWQSKDSGNGSIIDGNGLGLAGNGKRLPNGKYEYNGLYYYGRKPISTTSRCLPSKLSSVIPAGSANAYGDLSKYYLYGTKECEVDANKMNVENIFEY